MFPIGDMQSINLSEISNLEISDPEKYMYSLFSFSHKRVFPSKSELSLASKSSVISHTFDSPMNMCFG